MRLLLKMGFWLGVVLVLLPSGRSQPLPHSQVSAGEAISAAKTAVTDMQHFCSRQPGACEVGSQVAVTLGQRAQAGAKMLYEFLHEHFGGDEVSGVRTTGTVSGGRSSQNTLRPGDLAPAWRGPSAGGNSRNNRPA
jgi:hypothetical protein